MSKIEWEYDLVERPFCEQLKAMGWQWIEGDKDVPDFTERANFREVLLKGRLAAALRKLNLRKALPNAAIIGFTGTPILSSEKKETREIFGNFIDKYILQEAELDGATVPILYEGWTADGIVKDAPSLDAVFEDMFRDYTPEELAVIKAKYATEGEVMDAPMLIEQKTCDLDRAGICRPGGERDLAQRLVALARENHENLTRS